MTDRKLDGKVIDTRGEPAAQADVWFFIAGGSQAQMEADGSGAFSFDLTDAAAWPEGAYTLRVLPKGLPLEEARPVALAAEGSPPPQVIKVRRKEEISRLWGWIFLLSGILLLGWLGATYLRLHDFHLADLKPGSETVGEEGAGLREALKTARSEVEKSDSSPGVEALIPALEAVEKQLDESSAFLWSVPPALHLEVFFWALFATLLRLIFNAGYYLYKGTFLRTAVGHHLALAATIPVVAVIIAFVLSLIEFSLKLGETGLVLDMGNPAIAIVVAALVGLAPWKSWDFVRNLSDLLFAKLAGLFSAAGEA